MLQIAMQILSINCSGKKLGLWCFVNVSSLKRNRTKHVKHKDECKLHTQHCKTKSTHVRIDHNEKMKDVHFTRMHRGQKTFQKAN